MAVLGFSILKHRLIGWKPMPLRIEKGTEKGEKVLAVRLLGRKFPGISDLAQPLVEALSGPDLLAFGEELIFFESAEDCLAWLRQRG